MNTVGFHRISRLIYRIYDRFQDALISISEGPKPGERLRIGRKLLKYYFTRANNLDGSDNDVRLTEKDVSDT